MAVVVSRDLRGLRIGGYVAPWPVAMPHVPHLVVKSAIRLDSDSRGFIEGTIKQFGVVTNIPVGRRVRLLRDRDALLVGETWSNPTTGYFKFEQIDSRFTYTILSYDYTGAFRAVVADRVVPDFV